MNGFGAAFQTMGKIADYSFNSEMYERQNRDQAAREQDARRENYEYGEKAAENAFNRQKEFYEAYQTPQAQMKMLKEAGLSPSIFAGGGMTGAAAPSAPQGGGAAGIGHTQVPFQNYMELGQDLMRNAQIANLEADTEKKNSEREHIDIENSNDPIIKEYMVIRDELVKQADETESNQVNEAFTTLQHELTQVSFFNKTSNWSIQHSESKGEGVSDSYTVSFNDANGQSHSFNIGGSVSASVGVTNGGSVSANYGKSNASNTAHGESDSKSHASNWSKAVMDAVSGGKGESGYTREAAHILETFYTQAAEAHKSAENRRENAKKSFIEKATKYMNNKSRYESKHQARQRW